MFCGLAFLSSKGIALNTKALPWLCVGPGGTGLSVAGAFCNHKIWLELGAR